MERAVLLRYHEIALKGANRAWFEERLANNARKLVERAIGLRGSKIPFERLHGRIILDCEWNERVEGALARVFGLTSFSPMLPVVTAKESLRQAALSELETGLARSPGVRTFRVSTRRSEKALPERSMDLDREIGAAILEKHPGLKVDLENPDFVVGIELRFKTSYVWTQKVLGPGGLPVGTNGRVLALVSGGLDSPVAAISALKRGAEASFIHFSGEPFVGGEVLEKVEDLGRIVNRFQPIPQPLHVVPFGKIQERIALATSSRLRTVLYRRMMIRIACAVARSCDAQALVTGESLGQVASQTLENLSTINEAANLPVLRPLVCHDKEEIIDRARAWGTYETALRPGVDCCTLFADRHPAIRSTPASIAEQEARFPVEEWVAEAVAATRARRL